jgi:hypothetical protein
MLTTPYQLWKIALKVKNLLTIVGPAWRQICHNTKLKVWQIPCDVATRWNAMYNLLAFSVSYCITINKLTDCTLFKLKGLSDKEWALVEELINVLKVSLTLFQIAKRRTYAYACQLFKQAMLFFL